jgi:hypothetical protein
MLTDAQRVKFFKLARRAYSVVSPAEPFDAWRKAVMAEAGLPESVSQVDHIWGYEQLMLRFALLAYDNDQIGYWTSCDERRLRWVLKGLATDLEFIAKTGVGEDYVRGIYRQAGLLPANFDDAPAVRLHVVLQILDIHVRRLCEREGIPVRLLPTAGQPWQFRGVQAARYAAYVARATDLSRSAAGLPVGPPGAEQCAVSVVPAVA